MAGFARGGGWSGTGVDFAPLVPRPAQVARVAVADEQPVPRAVLRGHGTAHQADPIRGRELHPADAEIELGRRVEERAAAAGDIQHAGLVEAEHDQEDEIADDDDGEEPEEAGHAA